MCLKPFLASLTGANADLCLDIMPGEPALRGHIATLEAATAA